MENSKNFVAESATTETGTLTSKAPNNITRAALMVAALSLAACSGKEDSPAPQTRDGVRQVPGTECTNCTPPAPTTAPTAAPTASPTGTPSSDTTKVEWYPAQGDGVVVTKREVVKLASGKNIEVSPADGTVVYCRTLPIGPTTLTDTGAKAAQWSELHPASTARSYNEMEALAKTYQACLVNGQNCSALADDLGSVQNATKPEPYKNGPTGVNLYRCAVVKQ